MEIEAKFRVGDDAVFPALLALPALGPFRLEPEPVAEVQHNVYLDTADQRLRSNRHGLRIRTVGERRIVTLKGRAQFSDGVYERDEWEVEIGDDDRPSTWPPSEARERVIALAGDTSLAPTVTVHTDRHHIYAFHNGRRIAELSLDQGTIVARSRSEPFTELEIELLGDAPRADFDALVALLRERFVLLPEDRSKLARGLALLDEG